MAKKYCVIIDSYPQTPEDEEILLSNLKVLNGEGVDILLTSHSSCSSEIIENSTYFLFEKENDYHFLDSGILNENLGEVKNPIYLSYAYLENLVFRNRLVITGWSVAIASQMANSIKFLYGKGYDYAFYLISDCIFPPDIKFKIEEILEISKDDRNYFIKNTPNLGSWYAPFFFGFTIDENLVSRVPNVDFSENKTYQKYFPNCAFEDFLLRIWGGDKNFVAENSKLDEIFGKDKWNLSRSLLKKSPVSLHSNTSSSIYSNPETGEFCLMLMVYSECPCDEVCFEISISDLSENLLYEVKINLGKMHWFKCGVTDLIRNNGRVILKKHVKDIKDSSLFFEDSIVIDLKDFETYSIVKNFQTI